MKTGPTKESTRKTIVALDKIAKKTKNKVLKKVAEKLSSSTRKRTEVNIYKLSKLASKMPEKTLVVPGKVLSKGEAIENMKVVCLSYSQKAKEKIENAKGKIITFNEITESNLKQNEMVIIE